MWHKEKTVAEKLVDSTAVSAVATHPAFGTANALTKDISVSSDGTTGVIVAVIVILVVSFLVALCVTVIWT